MLNRLTTRHKELLTGLAAVTVALGLLIGRVNDFGNEQSLPMLATPESENINTLERRNDDAFYIDESTGLRLAVPGARFHSMQFNSLGFRGPEPDSQPDENIIRIAYLGNSITLNRHSFPDEKSWPGLTTQMLEETFPDCRFTYQNAGIPGAHSRQMTARYKEMISVFRPDIVVVMTDDRTASLNALARKSRLRNSKTEKLIFTKEQLLSHYVHDLPELLETILQEGAIPVLLGLGQRVREYQTDEEQATVSAPEIKNKPYMSVESLLNSAQWYNETNREIADNLKLTYVDWINRVPGEAAYFADFRHLNLGGSALMAEVLVDELQNSSVFTTTLFKRFGCRSVQREPGIVSPNIVMP